MDAEWDLFHLMFPHDCSMMVTNGSIYEHGRQSQWSPPDHSEAGTNTASDKVKSKVVICTPVPHARKPQRDSHIVSQLAVARTRRHRERPFLTLSSHCRDDCRALALVASSKEARRRDDAEMRERANGDASGSLRRTHHLPIRARRAPDQFRAHSTPPANLNAGRP